MTSALTQVHVGKTITNDHPLSFTWLSLVLFWTVTPRVHGVNKTCVQDFVTHQSNPISCSKHYSGSESSSDMVQMGQSERVSK